MQCQARIVKRVAIIQARMTSTRLPGKVLMDLAGKPMLARQLERLRGCSDVDRIVIATTVNRTDDPIAALAESEGFTCFRGSEDDVLSRYVGAAEQTAADLIVRITADCPLIAADVVDLVVRELVDHIGECDYASNVLERSYPLGLDAEAFTRETLMRCDRLADTAEAREHVTSIIRQDETGQFACRSVVDDEDNSDLRWTVDTAADMKLVRRLYSDLGLAESRPGYREIVARMRAHPELIAINAGDTTWDPVKDRSKPES